MGILLSNPNFYYPGVGDPLTFISLLPRRWGAPIHTQEAGHCLVEIFLEDPSHLNYPFTTSNLKFNLINLTNLNLAQRVKSHMYD